MAHNKLFSLLWLKQTLLLTNVHCTRLVNFYSLQRSKMSKLFIRDYSTKKSVYNIAIAITSVTDLIKVKFIYFI